MGGILGIGIANCTAELKAIPPSTLDIFKTAQPGMLVEHKDPRAFAATRISKCPTAD
jgi:hypothetical protein